MAPSLLPLTSGARPGHEAGRQRSRQFTRDTGRFEGSTSAFRRWAAECWLSYLFVHARYAPSLARWTKWIYLEFALRFSKTISSATFANARRIYGPDLSNARCRQFCRRVMSNFVNFVSDVGLCVRLSVDQMAERVESIDGREKYETARAGKRGAIVITAHMGSFESATAALLRIEPKIHVVFKRDDRSKFEQIRTQLRQRLGVVEVPVDDGWGIWIRLRDALLQNEVVMLQGDRLMPGQKGQRFAFLHGHIAVPTGPVRLALASGAPIVPIITTRTPKGRVRIHVEDAIYVSDASQMDQALGQIVGVIEKYVRQYPTQWLMLEPAFCEDMAEAR